MPQTGAAGRTETIDFPLSFRLWDGAKNAGRQFAAPQIFCQRFRVPISACGIVPEKIPDVPECRLVPKVVFLRASCFFACSQGIFCDRRAPSVRSGCFCKSFGGSDLFFERWRGFSADFFRRKNAGILAPVCRNEQGGEEVQKEGKKQCAKRSGEKL